MQHFTSQFVESSEHLLQKVRLHASGSKYVASSETVAAKLKDSFESKLKAAEFKLLDISSKFVAEMEATVKDTLYPTLSKGSDDSKNAAMAIIESWGSGGLRTKAERSPGRNGESLHLWCGS